MDFGHKSRIVYPDSPLTRQSIRPENRCQAHRQKKVVLMRLLHLAPLGLIFNNSGKLFFIIFHNKFFCSYKNNTVLTTVGGVTFLGSGQLAHPHQLEDPGTAVSPCGSAPPLTILVFAPAECFWEQKLLSLT